MNYTFRVFLLFLMIVSELSIHAQDIKGKVITGYQGWFSTPNSDTSLPYRKWWHWGTAHPSNPNALANYRYNISVPNRGMTFDLYPDISEYKADGAKLHDSGLGFHNLGNGNQTKSLLFSSADPVVSRVHLKWMQQHNIDALALQRFAVDVDPGGPLTNDPNWQDRKSHRDQVLSNMLAEAGNYGRKFYVMYDISGLENAGYTNQNWKFAIERDWPDIVSRFNLLNNPAYAKEDGKPVVCLWGLGEIGRLGDLTTYKQLIQWFKNQNVYVILGVHKWWHGAEDHRITNSPNVEERPYTQTRYREAYLMADMISPWYVGAFGQSGTTSFYNDIVAPQMQLCHDQNIDFMPVLWPGFSWYNLKNNGTFEHHPRNQGALFWGQVFNAKNKFNNYNNLKHNASLYIAMFDEFDEATAIMKAASRPDMLPPNPNDAQLLRYQGVESDFYLRLVKDAREVLKGSKCPQANVPTNPSKQYASSWNQQNCNPVTARQLGKEEVAHQAEVLNIYPNPSSEFISLEFRAAVDQLDYRITDITGRIVCQERTDVGGEQSLRVDVSQLSTGNYIIELTYNGQTNARRITIR